MTTHTKTVDRPILIADDDHAMVRTLSDVFRLAGWQTDGAFSGEEAVRRVGESAYAAVLMDVRMTGISGVEALREIRARRPTLPVFLMTAYASSSLLQEAEGLGVTGILHKPVSIRPLMALIASAAATRRAVLIVDDDPAFLASLSTALGDRGYDVEQASSLEGALSHLDQHPTLVVLLDLKLNGHDPQHVLDRVRAAAANSAIIVLSGYPDLLDAVTAPAPQQRLAGYLRKPFAPDQLTRMLDALLD